MAACYSNKQLTLASFWQSPANENVLGSGWLLKLRPSTPVSKQKRSLASHVSAWRRAAGQAGEPAWGSPLSLWARSYGLAGWIQPAFYPGLVYTQLVKGLEQKGRRERFIAKSPACRDQKARLPAGSFYTFIALTGDFFPLFTPLYGQSGDTFCLREKTKPADPHAAFGGEGPCGSSWWRQDERRQAQRCLHPEPEAAGALTLCPHPGPPPPHPKCSPSL